MTERIIRRRMFTLVTPEVPEKQRPQSTEGLPAVFYAPAKHYLEYSDPINDLGDLKRVDCPLNIDCEFVASPAHWTVSQDRYEYRPGLWIDKISRQSTRIHISTQIRGIHQTEGVIFSSRECASLLPRHKALVTGFDPIDYLKHLGYQVQLSHNSTKKLDKRIINSLPEFRFVLFSHFATAELMPIVRDVYWQDFERLVATPEPKKPPGEPRFSFKRVLKSITETIDARTGNVVIQPFVMLPWLLSINGRLFKISVEWIDSSALHGQSSYKDICKSAGVEIPYKDNFSPDEKARMLDMAIDRSVDFDSYALGDLYVWDALKGNAENFRKVYQSLGIEHLFVPPALTIGATCKNVIEGKLSQTIGVDYRNRDEMNFLRDNFLSPASAKNLRQNPSLTRCLTAKVEGGRCRNNRPTDWFIDNPICDIDLSGAYAECQRPQPYPIGNPEILDFEATNRSEFWTLGKFRKTYGSELVRGLWQARVWTSEPLEYAQDFLASWFMPSVGDDLLALGKYVQNLPTDTESEGYENEAQFELEDGQLKIFNREIINGVITDDFIDWIDNVATPRQRKELESKLLIKAAIIYPKSWQIEAKTPVEAYRKLVSEFKKHKDSDKIERINTKGRKKLRREDGQYHGWFSINLGDLIIDDLLAWRKYYREIDGKGSPMELLFKLVCNTIYGDMTSRYFDSANVVVGNAITARCRALVWYTEKGLHLLQTITDGGAFELNRCVFPNAKNRRVSGENVVDLYTLSDREASRERGLKFAPLGGYDKIELSWVDTAVNGMYLRDKSGNILQTPVLKFIENDNITKVIQGTTAHEWVNTTAMSHLQALFPAVTVLHAPSKQLKVEIEADRPVKCYTERIGQISFEMKSFFEKGVFHGSANYLLVSPARVILKMRSYESNKTHESVSLAYSVDIDSRDCVKNPFVSERYGDKNNPARDLLSQLLDGSQIDRQVPFVKQAILKPNDYKNNPGKYRGLGLVPGDSFYKTGLLREFSLSQFTFPTMAQFVEWEKRINRLKEKFGQSLEMYFITDEKKLDFDRMVRTIDKLIKEGEMNPVETLDPRLGKSRIEVVEHPDLGTFVSVKALLGLSNPD